MKNKKIDKDTILVINDIEKYSSVNGPGLRTVIWVQGCSIHCKGCFNKDLWDKNGGKKMFVSDILKQIPKDVDGITISGGEPFEQCIGLTKFIELFKKKFPKKTVIIFIGISKSLLIWASKYSLNEVGLFTSKESLVDMIIMNPYKRKNRKIKSFEDINKEVWNITGRIKDFKLDNSLEISISEDGEMLGTGFIDGRKLFKRIGGVKC